MRKGVISAFGQHFVKTGIFDREISREVNRAFEKRQLSDYEYTFVISSEEAEEILENAKGFTGKVETYLYSKNFLSK